jgi:hypothetical protein
MHTLNSTRRLTNALALLAAIVTGQVQAKETTLHVAENGSERTLQQSRKQPQDRANELAENGSERTLQQSRKQLHKRATELAESGSERTLQRSRRA